MAKKGRGKKGKDKNVNENKELVEWKKKELQKLWDAFLTQADQFEGRLNSVCENTCVKISKMYADKLKSIPEDIRNMTVSEYMEMQSKNDTENIASNVNSNIMSLVEKNKLASEKKKTLKKNKERKRSLSASICSGIKIAAPPSNLRVSRTFSDSCLSTPLSKRSAVPNSVITPKFNPRIPMNKKHLRRPRVGEIVMSISGSPLQNVVEDIPDKPGVAVSLGGGKVIKITEDTEIAKIEQDFIRKLDEDTKSTLENVKRKLERILQA